jgi:poly(A) polymerase
MLAHENRRRAVELALDLHLWPMILPEILLEWPSDRTTERTLGMLAELRSTSGELALAVLCSSLSPRLTGELCRRIRLSNEQREKITWLVEHQSSLEGADQLPLHRLKTLLAHPGHPELLEFLRARQVFEWGASPDFEYCTRFIDATPRERFDPPPLLTGGDLIEMGLKPGQEFKRLLEATRNAQLDEQLHDHRQALDFVARLRENPGEH